MNKQNPEQDQPISLYQSHAVIVSTIIGVGVISMQRGIAKEVGPDGIWTILIGGLIVLVEIVLITRLMQKFPGKTLAQFSSELLSFGKKRWLGKVLSIPLLVGIGWYWLLTIAIVTRTFSEVAISAVFPQTPMEVFMITMLGSACFAAGQRPELIARFNEFLMPFLFIPGLLILTAWMEAGDWENLLPMFQVTDWKKFLQGMLTSAYSYSGYSVLFVYMAYYQQPKKAMRAHILATGTVIVGYWVTIAASISIFGPFELANLMWPTLDLIKQVEVPGQILSRLESAIIGIWVVAVFTTLVNMFGVLVDISLTTFNLEERFRKWLAWGSLPFGYLVANRPANLEQLFRWNDLAGIYEIVMTLVIILILSILTRLRADKKGDQNASSSA
ncbi:GerAB/ArcD/ProY family transporter [Melghirimyces algeriensis]|uniref:Spore germination protein n=1 Tax=Melghirimyces algeriensis TaxID=910412 RepID=A0A521BIE9_9BACL|nr:endospore germination permease [Melghirimyces algeriensis]SMO46904.1 spore germination protein [Melghirimyces algeriensis]